MKDLADLRSDITPSQLESGELAQTYVQLQDQLRWAMSIQSFLSNSDLPMKAVNNLQNLMKKIREFYKNYANAPKFLGDATAYQKPDVVIILGANGELLKQRLNLALQLMQSFSKTPVILSGGGKFFYREADVMRQFLIEKGIASKRLMEETDSLDRVGNAVFSGLLLKQKKSKQKTYW